MPDTPETINRADYTPYPFELTETALAFDIRDGETTVDSDLAFTRRDGAEGDLVLYGVDVELVSLAVDGRELGGNEYAIAGETLTVFGVPDRCRVQVTTKIVPEDNKAFEGLYKSNDMYCTQCEAESFRKITYYPDRPDVLSRFTTTITADAARYPVLLSNGNLTGDDTIGGRRTVTWRDPFPKPSYLFALVAGDLAVQEDEFVTRSGRSVTLCIYSEPHNIGQCDYAMGALKRAMRWDEERFGREYDLDIFMIVAVEDFNMGAMENKGLNVFNTSCVLATAATATDDRAPARRGRRCPRVFPQLVGQPRDLPRLVPTQPQGRLHRVPGRRVHVGHELADHQARRGRRIPALGAVRRGRRPVGAPGAARQLRGDLELLHHDGLREGRRGGSDAGHHSRPRPVPRRDRHLL